MNFRGRRGGSLIAEGSVVHQSKRFMHWKKVMTEDGDLSPRDGDAVVQKRRRIWRRRLDPAVGSRLVTGSGLGSAGIRRARKAGRRRRDDVDEKNGCETVRRIEAAGGTAASCARTLLDVGIDRMWSLG